MHAIDNSVRLNMEHKGPTITLVLFDESLKWDTRSTRPDIGTKDIFLSMYPGDCVPITESLSRFNVAGDHLYPIIGSIACPQGVATYLLGLLDPHVHIAHILNSNCRHKWGIFDDSNSML